MTGFIETVKVTMTFTAYLGTKDLIHKEQELDKANRKVIQSFRLIADLAGFEIVGRITLKHKKSGKLFR